MYSMYIHFYCILMPGNKAMQAEREHRVQGNTVYRETQYEGTREKSKYIQGIIGNCE